MAELRGPWRRLQCGSVAPPPGAGRAAPPICWGPSRSGTRGLWPKECRRFLQRPPAPPSGVAGLLGHRQTHFSAPPTGLCRERVEEDLGLRLGQSFLLMLVVSLPSHFPVNVSIFCDRVKPCPVFAWLGLG